MSRVAIVDKTDRYIDSVNPFPVTVVDFNNQTNSFIEFQEALTVATGVLTTVLTFTNSTGEAIFIHSVGGTASANAEWYVYINTVLKLKRRTNVSTTNWQVLLNKFKMNNGDIIDIKAIHVQGPTQDFHSEVRYDYG